jgi:hypothetical protein
MTVKVLLGMIAGFALAGCLTETTTKTVASAPLSVVETEVFNLIVTLGFDAGIAQVIARDCPRLRYDERLEARQTHGLAKRVTDMLDGDAERAAELVDRLERQTERQRVAVIQPRLLAYIKANDYLPGSAETACRVGSQERRNNSTIGQLLVPE